MNCAVHTQNQATAYCRTCGKALCEDCKRDVMGAIYCEPCIAARLQGGAAPGIPAGVPAGTPSPAGIPGAPNPVTAGILGFVPGVGAMYNGQFAKAFVHVVIFVMLVIAANNVHEAFGFGIAFFEFYMAFEAYKTAEAKRHGLPLPDPMGLDRMFGIQESQTHAPAGSGIPATADVPGSTLPPPPLQVEPPQRAVDNTPVGAFILIILGMVFLLDNFGLLRIHQFWPLFLIGLGLWIAYKRISRPVPGGTQ